MRTRLLAVAVVLSVLLAGCGGFGGGNGTTPAPGATDTTTDDPTTTTTTPQSTTTTGTDTPTTTEDSTTTTSTTTTTTTTTTTPGDSGDLPADAGQRHRQALQDAGSFTLTQRVTYRNETTTFLGFEYHTRLDQAAGRGYQNGSVVLGGFTSVQSTYTDGDVTYRRTNSSFGGLQYDKATAPYSDDSVQPVNLTTVVGTATNVTGTTVSFDRVGTETYDGVQTTRYEASGEALAKGLGIGGEGQFENATLRSASMYVLVDSQGVFRRTHMEVVLDTEESGTVVILFDQRVTALGSTTVSAPGWLDEAKDRTD